jgi:hypothetical protein
MRLKTWIDFAWSSAVRCVTSDIEKFAFFFTSWACVGGHRGCDEKTAMAAFPKSQTAIGADISREFTFCCVTTMGTFEFIHFLIHFLFLSSKNLRLKLSYT